jgi:hypothetical protein
MIHASGDLKNLFLLKKDIAFLNPGLLGHVSHPFLKSFSDINHY